MAHINKTLELHSVSKKYGRGENSFLALNEVNINFKSGTTNAIIGKSGSGKSTLLHILTGLDHATGGTVLFEDKNIIKELNTDTWRGKHVGIVFQQFFLQPNDTVLDNVALPLKIRGIKKSERLEMAKEALERVGLAEKIRNKANDLSGGQKQRVAIARAIVDNPSIIIADEPTGNLDSENSKIIEDLLFELHEKLGTTVLIVTHDEDLARRCERIIYLKDGLVAKDTQKAELKGRK